MNVWSFIYKGFDPKKEGLREALCTLGNGYFATRGAAEESSADGVHYPGSYLAGGYNRLKSKVKDKVIENEDLVNLPNWLVLNFRIENGEWFDLKKVKILSYVQKLDLKKGMLIRRVYFEDSEGRRTKITHQRLVHMRNIHRAGLKTTLRAENWSGKVEIVSALDGRVVNAGVERYKKLNSQHLVPLKTKQDKDVIHLMVKTSQSKILIAQSARTSLYSDGKPLSCDRTTKKEPGYIAHHMKIDMEQDTEVCVGKIVTLFTSKDRAISEPGMESLRELKIPESFDELQKSHITAWESLWRHFGFDIALSDSREDSRQELILHLYVFHLLQTVSPHTRDLDVGVPARGWHGEAYRGHIFWDELFIFPILNLRVPEITRALLMYRYRRLNEARRGAKKAGFRGAMYPWQSGSNGREESQKIHLNPRSGRWIPDNSHLQRHVNVAIAYNIWQYYQVTNDLEFITFFGAEMFLEIARFLADLTTYNSKETRYEIHNVMGPDEYHDRYPGKEDPGLNNNAYTNIMVVWVLNRAMDLLKILAEDHLESLRDRIGLKPDEIEKWDQIRHRMKVVFHDSGIISQFEGYEDLEEFDWEKYKKKYGDIQRLDRILEAEGDTPNRYKASKQADVLMLFYLLSSEQLQVLFRQLGYEFTYGTIPRNIDYYLQRTSHGSTLSRVVHSWVLSRSNRTKSWELFNEALESDVADIQGGTTPEGVHLGAMAGTIDLLQRCYSGIEVRKGILWFNPNLPEHLTRLEMKVRFLSHSIQVVITPGKLCLTTLKSSLPSIKIGVNGDVHELKAKDRKEFDLIQG
ncbi:MAG: glycoside hydrolase family 65 protein [Candidatus Aminicenantes bacterium]|nr:glycoside hydrolase family 65 protein [Candidatus Aminicenantes bacterium]